MTESELLSGFRHMGEREKGRFGEAVFKQVFVSSGLRFIPLCDIQNGGAPMMEGADKVILPDFELIGNGFSAYVDAKCKGQSVLFRNRNQVRHGIDRRNYQHYCAAGHTTRRECGLGIVELFDETGECWSGSLLAESFRNLGAPIPGMSDQDHMVYWPRKMFADLNSFSPSELMDIAKARLKCDCSFELRRIFGPEIPKPQACLDGRHAWTDKRDSDGLRRECSACGSVYGRVREVQQPGGPQKSLF